MFSVAVHVNAVPIDCRFVVLPEVRELVKAKLAFVDPAAKSIDELHMTYSMSRTVEQTRIIVFLVSNDGFVTCEIQLLCEPRDEYTYNVEDHIAAMFDFGKFQQVFSDISLCVTMGIDNDELAEEDRKTINDVCSLGRTYYWNSALCKLSKTPLPGYEKILLYIDEI
jgi:hypothetical protein